MRRYKYVVEYSGKLYVIEVEDREEDGMVIVGLATDDFVIKYVNDKGEDKVNTYLQELWVTDTSDETIEEFMTNVSFILSYGNVLAILETDKQLVVLR